MHEPDDPSIVDCQVAQMFWYHTSTIPNWPQKDFDPQKRLTREDIQSMTRMLGEGAVERWTEREKSKALHVGTYESAIENMLRRMKNQPEGDSPFYLFRVVLHESAGIEPGIHSEPTNFVGDVHPDEFLTTGNSIYRYINEYEDEGGISLALTTDAIKSVVGVQIPLNPGSISTSKIVNADANAAERIAKSGVPERIREILEDGFNRRCPKIDDQNSIDFLGGLINLITNPSQILGILDSVEPRLV